MVLHCNSTALFCEANALLDSFIVMLLHCSNNVLTCEANALLHSFVEMLLRCNASVNYTLFNCLPIISLIIATITEENVIDFDNKRRC